MALAVTYLWPWRARLPDRRGQRFRVLARGRLNSMLIQFEDGARFITSRNALVKSEVLACPTAAGRAVATIGGAGD